MVLLQIAIAVKTFIAFLTSSYISSIFFCKDALNPFDPTLVLLKMIIVTCFIDK